jgi:6-pyruvoyl-tetrahydropterin synthase
MKLTRKYFAEAAHQLSAGVPDGHPCKRLHGHRYEIDVTIVGNIDSTGMVMEYDEIDRRIGEVLGFVDHRFTNLLGLDVRVIEEVATLPKLVLRVEPIQGAKILEQELAARVRQNSTVENLKNWFSAELMQRFADSGVSVEDVDIREDPRSSVRS